MPLIPIPHEKLAEGDDDSKKSFRPQLLEKERSRDEKLIKHLCAKLAEFLDKSSRFTVQQIDELIMGMQRSILSLKRKKKELLETATHGNGNENGKKKKKHFWFPFRKK